MDFRQRLEQSRNIPDKEPERETEELAKDQYFGVSTLSAQVSCMDLRLPGGKRVAVPYAYINGLRFDPETGIEFSTSRERIAITGRNLAKLYEYLVLYRVRFIQVNLGGDTQEDGVFVEDIRVEPVEM